MNGNSDVVEKAESELVIERVFDAPRELVWRAWTEAERLAQWWGPKGCEIEVKTLEFQPGGVFLYCMRLPDGNAMWGKFTYNEIEEPSRMSYISAFSDENGGTTRAPFFDGKWPLEVSNTLTLTEEIGQTTLTLRGNPINATEIEKQAFADAHSSMQQGFAGTMEQLTEFLAKG